MTWETKNRALKVNFQLMIVIGRVGLGCRCGEDGCIEPNARLGRG